MSSKQSKVVRRKPDEVIEQKASEANIDYNDFHVTDDGVIVYSCTRRVYKEVKGVRSAEYAALSYEDLVRILKDQFTDVTLKYMSKDDPTITVKMYGQANIFSFLRVFDEVLNKVDYINDYVIDRLVKTETFNNTKIVIDPETGNQVEEIVPKYRHKYGITVDISVNLDVLRNRYGHL